MITLITSAHTVHRVVKAKKGIEMKKASLLLIVISLLMVSVLCFAAPREADWVSEGESNFTNLGVSGTDSAPGYIKLTDGDAAEFYLWIGTDGKMRMASPLAVSYTLWGVVINGELPAFLGATPALVKWEDASGVVIGAQTSP